MSALSSEQTEPQTFDDLVAHVAAVYIGDDAQGHSARAAWIESITVEAVRTEAPLCRPTVATGCRGRTDPLLRKKFFESKALNKFARLRGCSRGLPDAPRAACRSQRCM